LEQLRGEARDLINSMPPPQYRKVQATGKAADARNKRHAPPVEKKKRDQGTTVPLRNDNAHINRQGQSQEQMVRLLLGEHPTGVPGSKLPIYFREKFSRELYYDSSLTAYMQSVEGVEVFASTFDRLYMQSVTFDPKGGGPNVFKLKSAGQHFEPQAELIQRATEW
jgi:hypothetical protein